MTDAQLEEEEDASFADALEAVLLAVDQRQNSGHPPAPAPAAAGPENTPPQAATPVVPRYGTPKKAIAPGRAKAARILPSSLQPKPAPPPPTSGSSAAACAWPAPPQPHHHDPARRPIFLPTQPHSHPQAASSSPALPPPLWPAPPPSTQQHPSASLHPPAPLPTGVASAPAAQQAGHAPPPPSQGAPEGRYALWMPGLKLPTNTTIIYASTPEHVEWCCQRVQALRPAAVGFDQEWRALFLKGRAPPKVALLQLAFYPSEEATRHAQACARAAAALLCRQEAPQEQQQRVAPGAAPAHAHAQRTQQLEQQALQQQRGELPPQLQLQAEDQQPPLGQQSGQQQAAHQAAAIPQRASGSSSSSGGGSAGGAGGAGVAGVPEQRERGHGLEGVQLQVLLLQVAGMAALPPALVGLLGDPTIAKVGVGITNDGNKLRGDYGAELRGQVELGEMANARVLRHRPMVTTDVTTGRFSLQGVLGTLTHHWLPKVQSVRCSNWEARPLTAAQQQYAALDAWAGLLVHTLLEALPRREGAAGTAPC